MNAATTIEDDGPLYPDVEVQLTGLDSNAMVLMSAVTQALKRAGYRDAVDPFRREAMSGDYDHLLSTCMRYVNVS